MSLFGSIHTKFLKAARMGNLRKVSELLAKGAAINFEDAGKTALCHAVCNGHRSVAEFLLDKKARSNSIMGEPPLHSAVVKGDIGMVELLLANGAKIDESYWSGRDNYPDSATALDKAAEAGNYEMTKLLLSKGANPNIENNKGYTSIYHAEKNKHGRVAELLRVHGGRIPSRIQAQIRSSNADQMNIQKALARVPAFTEKVDVEVRAKKSLTALDRIRYCSDGWGWSSSHGSDGNGYWTGAIDYNKARETLEAVLHSLNDEEALSSSEVLWHECKGVLVAIPNADSQFHWRRTKCTRIWPL